MKFNLPDGTEAVEATPHNLPAHVDNNPDTCGCPVIITGPDTAPTECGIGVGWVLQEVEDTYDSGYERLQLAESFIVEGFWVVCGDCISNIEEPETGWTFVIPERPTETAGVG